MHEADPAALRPSFDQDFTEHRANFGRGAQGFDLNIRHQHAIPRDSASMIEGTGGAPPLDLCNPFDILDLQVTAAFENFQRVFLISEAQPFGFPNAEGDDATRGGFPGRAMRRLPVKVIPDSLIAPFRRVLVERRTVVVTGGWGTCRARRRGRRTPDSDLRHRRLAPGK